MPGKKEKENRKKILNTLRIKAREEFENSLPLSREIFKKLFDHLDAELTIHGCNRTLTLTEVFLVNNNISNIDAVKNWLADKGGYCDCEVLANVEEQFE